MSAAALNRRVVALENSAPVIDDLADFVRWHAEGCPSNRRWDPVFEMQMEDTFSKYKRGSGLSTHRWSLYL